MEIKAKEELSKFLAFAAEAGMPRDQVENFMRCGYIPQRKQCIFHALSRLADFEDGPDEIGFGGSRGPGKSHGIFSQVALDDCSRVHGLKWLYLRKIGKQAKEQLEDLRNKVLFCVPHDYSRHEGVISFPQWGNSRILLGHFKDEKDIEGYLGLEYDGIAVEEATTLSPSKYQALRDSNRTSKTGWRPRIYNSTNPGGVGHRWYKKRFITPYREGSEKFTRFIPSTLDDNKFIDNNYRRKVEENTGWKLRAYRFGDFDIEAGQYFEELSFDRHVVKPFQIPAHWRRFGVYDPGWNHPAGFIWVAVDEESNLYVYRAYLQRNRRVDQIAEDVHKFEDTKALQHVVAGLDAWAHGRDGGPTIAEQMGRLLPEHLRLTLIKSHTDRIQGANELRRRLAWQNMPSGMSGPRIFFFDTQDCRMVFEKLTEMVHDPDKPDDVLKVDADDDDVFSGDEFYDLVRYACMSRPMRAKPLEQEPVRKSVEENKREWFVRERQKMKERRTKRRRDATLGNKW